MTKNPTKTTPPSEQEIKRQKREVKLSIIGLIVVIAAMAIVYSVVTRNTSRAEVKLLRMEDLVTGTGQETKAGDKISVHYTGWLADNKKFDSSVDRNQPFEFVLGKGKVIKGWDKGLIGMKAGGKRKLIIPPQMAYGAQGSGGTIPPNATLTFEVELLSVQ